MYSDRTLFKIAIYGDFFVFNDLKGRGEIGKEFSKCSGKIPEPIVQL